MTNTLRRTIRLGVVVVGGLALGVAGLGGYAVMQRQSGAPAGPAPVMVTVTSRGCEPAALQVEAGRVTFQIVNRSERAVEWEILDGVMVVDERENIAPGLSQRLATRLEPGEYAITCGLLSNPRGRLTVTPSASGTERRRPELIALVGPMAEYKVFVTIGASDLADTTETLAAAIHGGDRAAALAALAEARAAYGRIRPATKMLFADLDTAIDASAANFPGGAADANFTGLQRLAAGLAGEQPVSDLGAIADRLDKDVRTLRDRLTDVTIAPGRMVAGASLLLGEAAATSPGRDAAVVAANIDGAEKVADLLKPLTRKVDPAASDHLDASFAAARKELAAPAPAESHALSALAAALATLRDTLGLDG